MTRRPTLIPDLPAGLGIRQRLRADGTLRLWWEPSAEARARGVKPVDLDPGRVTWSIREARRLVQAAGTPDRKRVTGTTINHAIDDFEKSLAFRQLKPATQRSYRANHRLIRTKWGSHLVADFTKPVLRTWYETLHAASGNYQALNLIRSMSILFSHCETRGWREENSNPCARMKLEIPKGRRRVVSWAEFDALIAAADAAGLVAIGHAITLSAIQGARQTDVLAPDRRAFFQIAVNVGDGQRETVWAWRFERSKRGNEAVLALHDEAARRLGPALRSVSAGPIYHDERTGRPYDGDLFRDRWSEVRAAAIKAGCKTLADVQFRDLRRTFGANSRAGGASKDDVGDVLGNSAAVNPMLADIYMAPQVETSLRAIRAIRRPADHAANHDQKGRT